MYSEPTTGYTTVRVSRETLNMLAEIGKKRDTYDQIIRHLIEIARATHASPTPAVAQQSQQ